MYITAYRYMLACKFETSLFSDFNQNTQTHARARSYLLFIRVYDCVGFVCQLFGLAFLLSSTGDFSQYNYVHFESLNIYH